MDLNHVSVNKDPPATFIPQYVVEGVIDELPNYNQAAGEYHWDFSENRV